MSPKGGIGRLLGRENRRELLLRLASALVLGAGVLYVTYLGGWPFLLLLALGAALMAQEWGRIVRGRPVDSLIGPHIFAALVALFLAAQSYLLIACLVLLLVAVLLHFLSGERHTRPWSAAGVLYTGLPVAALAWLSGGMAGGGSQAIFYLFAVVWATDIGAYVVGRLIGGPKLAPRISPGKTWAGFVGGVLLGAMVGWGFALFAAPANPGVIALLSLGLAMVSQLGDLLESALKRHFGVKDSGTLIPGHGGILDRVDGLVTAALLAALVAYLHGGATPWESLFLW